MMGMLIEGSWVDKWYDTDKSAGKFVRENAKFRNQISTNTEFKPEAARYHLYVSLACPWAHRTLIMRNLKNLQNIIDVTVVHPHMLTNGWEFKSDEIADCSEPLYNLQYVYELYLKSKNDYTGRVTVPILWDKQLQIIVNNESSEIIRIFNDSFNDLTTVKHDYYPQNLQKEIDKINELVYHNINNGVYKCGFATTQSAYDEALPNLFNSLDEIEKILSSNQYLVGNVFTEADIRIFTTLIRFDLVYFGHFKTNLRQIKDYPNIQAYVDKLYNLPEIKSTVNFHHIKQHYYYSHAQINPYRIVPAGPIHIK